MPTIRSATLADADAVVDLWDRAGGPTRLAGRVPEVERLLTRDPDALIVAVERGAIVGSVVLGWDGWRAHLYRVAVDEDARRTGVATALLAEVRARATAHGAVRLDAMVNLGNSDAIAFWEAIGFDGDDHDARWSSPL